MDFFLLHPTTLCHSPFYVYPLSVPLIYCSAPLHHPPVSTPSTARHPPGPACSQFIIYPSSAISTLVETKTKDINIREMKFWFMFFSTSLEVMNTSGLHGFNCSLCFEFTNILYTPISPCIIHRLLPHIDVELPLPTKPPDTARHPILPPLAQRYKHIPSAIVSTQVETNPKGRVFYRCASG